MAGPAGIGATASVARIGRDSDTVSDRGPGHSLFHSSGVTPTSLIVALYALEGPKSLNDDEGAYVEVISSITATISYFSSTRCIPGYGPLPLPTRPGAVPPTIRAAPPESPHTAEGASAVSD